MGGECDEYERETHTFCLQEEDHLARLVEGTILKRILRKWDMRIWAALVCTTTGKS